MYTLDVERGSRAVPTAAEGKTGGGNHHSSGQGKEPDLGKRAGSYQDVGNGTSLFS